MIYGCINDRVLISYDESRHVRIKCYKTGDLRVERTNLTVISFQILPRDLPIKDHKIVLWNEDI